MSIPFEVALLTPESSVNGLALAMICSINDVKSLVQVEVEGNRGNRDRVYFAIVAGIASIYTV